MHTHIHTYTQQQHPGAALFIKPAVMAMGAQASALTDTFLARLGRGDAELLDDLEAVVRATSPEGRRRDSSIEGGDTGSDGDVTGGDEEQEEGEGEAEDGGEVEVEDGAGGLEGVAVQDTEGSAAVAAVAAAGGAEAATGCPQAGTETEA